MTLLLKKGTYYMTHTAACAAAPYNADCICEDPTDTAADYTQSFAEFMAEDALGDYQGEDTNAHAED